MGLLFSSENTNMKLGLNLYDKLLASNDYRNIHIPLCTAVIEVNIAASLAINNKDILRYLMSQPQFDPFALNGMVFIEAVKHNKLEYVSLWLHNADIQLVTGCLTQYISFLSKDMMLTLLPRSKFILQDYIQLTIVNNCNTLLDLDYTVSDDACNTVITNNLVNILTHIKKKLTYSQIMLCIRECIRLNRLDCYYILKGYISERRVNDLIDYAISCNNSAILDLLQDKQPDTIVIIN